MVRRLFLILLTATISYGQTVSAQQVDATKASALIEKANGLLEKGKAKDAVGIYRQALLASPDNETALFNGGMAAFSAADYAQAKELWTHLKTLAPEDWRLRAKLIQVYQALGDTASRDKEREDLLALNKRQAVDQEKYCREQAEIDGKPFMAFEYFEMKGDRAVRYVFYVLNAKGEEDYHLSLGSYDLTNAIWAEKNKEQASKGQRLFHLDGYYNWGHATFGFYTPEPSYDEIRKVVAEIVREKVKALSSTRVTKDGADVKIK